MKKLNNVWAKITQTIEETDRKKPFSNTVEFSDSTAQQVTSGVFSDWLICKLRHYLKIQRLQKQTGFKMNDKVEIELGVNGKKNRISMKLSLNVERLEKLLEDSPELVAEVFTPSPTLSGLIKGGKELAHSYIHGDQRKVVLAKATKNAKELDNKTEDVEASIEGSVMNVLNKAQ